jgi:hypothetical protein
MSAFTEGYQAFTQNAGVNISAISGGEYVGNVETAIGELERAFNQDLRFTACGEVIKTGIKQLKGDAAEFWHAYTHNVDAAVKGVTARAEVIRSHVVGSVDVQGNWYDSAYGLKYIKDAKGSAKDQAEIYRAKYEQWAKNRIKDGVKPLPEEYFKIEYEKYIRECKDAGRSPQSFDEVFPGANDLNNPLYLGQFRLVPRDQLKDAETYLKRWLAEESHGGRSEQVKRYQDALDKLTDRIKSSEGSESIPLSKDQAEKLAEIAKEGEFDPADWGITTEDLIEWEYIMQQAYKAGLSAAVISIVLEVAPKLLETITKLINDGEVDAEDFKRVGFAALKGSSLGFVRGSVASALTIACKSGKFGMSLKDVNPTVIGAVVALTMNTLQGAVLMSFGKMSKQEFADQCIQNLFTASCSLALGSALQSLLPELPVLGFMLGSFIGSAVGSFAYKTGYNCVMSYCVDTGCTFFGLVDQDYALPDNILKEIGLEVFEYEKFEPEAFELEKFELERFDLEKFELDSIGITFLRRGVIGVGRVGYL